MRETGSELRQSGSRVCFLNPSTLLLGQVVQCPARGMVTPMFSKWKPQRLANAVLMQDDSTFFGLGFLQYGNYS